MKTILTSRSLNSTSANRAIIPFRVLRWIAIDAVLGAASGALFGFAFGAFGLLLNADSWSIVSVAGYFVLCGTAAGAVVGACGAILEGDEVSDTAGLSCPSTLTRNASATSEPGLTHADDQSNRRLPRNRLINVDSRGHQTSRNPSQN